MQNNIELEMRAEISSVECRSILKKLKGRKFTKTKRLTVMFLGEFEGREYDIRVRASSDKRAEVVIKKGEYYKHDRIEMSAEINKKQFMDFVKIFSLFGFRSKITTRINYLFEMGDNIFLTIVKAGGIAYVEIEKMSNEKNIGANKKQITAIINSFGLVPLTSESFDNLCHRLSLFSDAPFSGEERDFVYLKKAISKY
jgi:hypothetical protein